MNNSSNNENGDSEFLRLIYQESCNEIRFFKNQQWKVTNYGMLLYAAIVGIASLFKGVLPPHFRFVLIFLSLAIPVGGWAVLKQLENSIHKSRKQIIEIINSNKDKFLIINKPQEIISIFWLLLFVFAIGAFLLFLLLLFKF